MSYSWRTSIRTTSSSNAQRHSTKRALLQESLSPRRPRGPLIGRIPDAAQPEHTYVQDALAALYHPRHSQALEPLGAHKFARSLRDASAARKALAAVMP